ncbi:MAG: bile acid:sodium symporter, partial [Thermomicrobiales bacterium]
MPIPTPSFQTLRTNLGTTTLLVGAIALGAALGSFSDGAATRLGGWIDPTIVALVTLLIFEMRPEGIRHAGSNLRFVAIAWVCNFLVIPVIGYGVASLFLHGQPLALTGLVIYFMAPCTDWFLGFTRLAKGNATLGAALIPINMVSQLALYPVYLHLFAGRETGFTTGEIPATLIQWFLIPLVVALALHLGLRLILPDRPFARVLDGAGSVIPWVIALLVVEI